MGRTDSGRSESTSEWAGGSRDMAGLMAVKEPETPTILQPYGTRVDFAFRTARSRGSQESAQSVAARRAALKNCFLSKT
jgi:hypothetical protein